MVVVEVDEAVAVKEIELSVEAGGGDSQGECGAADVELFVLVVVEGGGDVAEQTVAVAPEVVAPTRRGRSDCRAPSSQRGAAGAGT